MIKKVVFTFGRFNPPQKGHALVINKTVDLAKKLGAENRIYTSKSTDTNKNPIPYRDKIEILRQLFPNANIVDDPQAATAFHICKALSESEYDEVIMVVGSDRVREFKQSIGKYVKDRKDPDFSPQKNYGFSKFDVVSAGERDPDNEGVSGLSGTKMREFVRKDDFASFAKGIPTNNARLAKKVFDIIKKNLQEEFIINEDVTRDKFGPMLDSFVSFASDKLGLKSFPNFKYKDHDDDSKSFGGYNPSSEEIVIVTKNRHPMDIFRTVAHELVHHKQNGEGRIKDVEKEGATGSDIENEANSEAGKVMRWFAKANPALFKSSYVTEDTIKEGINDPSQHKAIFIAGGTGSGKDFVMNRTLRGHGLTEINSDTALEHLMKKSGLNLSMPKKEEKPRNIARGRAKNLTREKERLALSGGKGVIINGTADAPEKIARIKDELEKSGYQTKMLFVHASNRTSKKRNEDRGKLGQRRVKESIRAEKWKDAQKAKPTYIKMFGDEHFTHVDNSDDYNSVSPERKTAIDKEHANIFKSVRSFVSTPADTPMASAFTQREVARRGITKLSPVRAHKLKENIEEAKKMRGSDPCWSGYK
ncbi:MAG: zeta toxin family protein, partial [bacterium]